MPAARIFWIASYPKSGNTWLRFLACNLVFGPIDSAESLNRFAPDLHELRAGFEPPAGMLLMKTHFPYSTALPFSTGTVGAIYVIRDPADVMLSNFHYGRRSGAVGGDLAESFARYVDRFIDSLGDPRWTQMGMGTWEQNVRSWIGIPHDFPVLPIWYEDLLSDGAGVADALCRCLGISRSAADRDAALQGASFHRMREIEESDIRDRRVGIFYKPYLQRPLEDGLRFMRSGKRGEAVQILSEVQRRRVDEAFGGVRREFGFR